MSDQDDLLTSLVSGTPNTAAGVAAMVQALRRNQDLGNVAQASGLSNLKPLGDSLVADAQQNITQAGQQAQKNVSEATASELEKGRLTRWDDQNANSARDSAQRLAIAQMEDQTRRDIAQGKLSKSSALEPQDQAQVDAIGHYNLPLPQSRSGRNGNIIDAVAEQYPGYDSTKYGEKKTAQVAFGTGPQGNSVRQATAAIQHLDSLDSASSGLSNSSFPLANTVVNFVKNAAGSPDMAKFNAARDVVSNEIEKFIIGGPSALADRKALQDQLNSADSPQKVQAVTDKLRELMRGQMEGLQGQYERAGLGDFSQNFTNNRTREVLGMNPLPTTGPLSAPNSAFRGVQPQSEQPSALPMSTGYNPQGMVKALGGNGAGMPTSSTTPAPQPQTPQGGLSAGPQQPIPVRSLPTPIPGVSIVKKARDSKGKEWALLSNGQEVPLD